MYAYRDFDWNRCSYCATCGGCAGACNTCHPMRGPNPGVQDVGIIPPRGGIVPSLDALNVMRGWGPGMVSGIPPTLMPTLCTQAERMGRSYAIERKFDTAEAAWSDLVGPFLASAVATGEDEGPDLAQLDPIKTCFAKGFNEAKAEGYYKRRDGQIGLAVGGVAGLVTGGLIMYAVTR